MSKQRLVRTRRWCDLPLECKIEVHHEDANGVPSSVRSASILGGHGSQNRGGDDDTNKAGYIHPATRVDPVVQPGTEGVINKT